MPIIQYASSAAKPCYSAKTAFEAVGIGIPDPDAEISFAGGCASMGFYRQNFQIALKRQQNMDALGKIVDGARLPAPHWKGGSQWFHLREVEAYVAATQSA